MVRHGVSMIRGGRCGPATGQTSTSPEEHTPDVAGPAGSRQRGYTRITVRMAESTSTAILLCPRPTTTIRSPRDVRMHVAPIDLRAVQQDGLKIRFALLGSMAYVLAEAPDSGSAGTSLEQPCVLPHWGIVIGGELRFVTARRRLTIPAGRVFHVPAGGREHHFESNGSVLIAAFQPIEADLDVSDEGLAAQGFEIVSEPPMSPVVPPIPTRRIPPGEVDCETWQMDPFIMSRVKMG